MRRYFADKTCINLIRLVLLLVTALLDALAYYFIPVAPYLSALPVVLWAVIITVTVAGLFAAMVEHQQPDILLPAPVLPAYLLLRFPGTGGQAQRLLLCADTDPAPQCDPVYHLHFHTLFQDHRAEFHSAERIRRLHAAALSEQAGL